MSQGLVRCVEKIGAGNLAAPSSVHRPAYAFGEIISESPRLDAPEVVPGEEGADDTFCVWWIGRNEHDVDIRKLFLQHTPLPQFLNAGRAAD